MTALLDGVNLAVRVVTDLPLKTRIALNITRPSRGYIWTNLDDTIPITQIVNDNGFEFSKSIKELDESALHKYRHWKGRWPGQIEGVPDNTFVVHTCLNALKHKFGTCNRALTGSQIEIRPSGHWIERTITVTAPIPDWLPQKLP